MVSMSQVWIVASGSNPGDRCRCEMLKVNCEMVCMLGYSKDSQEHLSKGGVVECICTEGYLWITTWCRCRRNIGCISKDSTWFLKKDYSQIGPEHEEQRYNDKVIKLMRGKICLIGH